VSESKDKTLRLWDAVTGAHQKILEGHTHRVVSVAFSPDGTHIVSGSDDKTLRLWDAMSGVQLRTFEGNFDVSSLARSINSNSSTVFGYITDDGWIYSIIPERRLCWIPFACRPTIAPAVSGHRVAFGLDDGRVVVLDLTA
jgi:WD40 repeat protein